MFSDFLPIRLYTQEMLQQVRIKNASLLVPFSFSKNAFCFSCPWENICKNNFPCLVFAYSAYAPRHFLTALTKLGYKVLLLESIQRKRMLRVTFDNGKSFTFSVSIIISSAECIHITLQLLLRWNLIPQSGFFIQKINLPRYYFLPKW